MASSETVTWAASGRGGWRGRGLPRAVRGRWAVPRGERVMAWAFATGADARGPAGAGVVGVGGVAAVEPEVVVATTGGLWVLRPSAVGSVGAAGVEVAAAEPWHRIDSAVWDPEDRTLIVVAARPDGRPRVVHRLSLPRAGSLPDVVHARVTACIVWRERVPVVGCGTVLVVARRVPGERELAWSAVPEEVRGRVDAQTVERIAAAVAAVRARLEPPSATSDVASRR